MSETPKTESKPPRDYALLHDALIVALPGEAVLVASWWRRVQAAADDGDAVRLKFLKAEAENRLDHASQKHALAILKLLFRILGLVE